MIIGIDGNEANVEKQVGVSVYSRYLLKYFEKIANQDLQFKIYLREEPKKNLPSTNPFFQYQIVKGKILWSQFFLPLHLYLKKNIDIFFAPAHYAPRFSPVPYVVTIHDLSFFYYPDEFLKIDLFKLKDWTQRSVKNAKKIIAVSKNTKKDVLKFYQTPESKVNVVYNGFEKPSSPNTNTVKSVLEKFNLKTKKYILYVGTLQPRKNITTLIKAFSKVSETEPDWKLVLVGKKGWLYQNIYEEVNRLNLANKVLFTDYIPDEEVAALYTQAFCFVLPSLYEGFGIPILEAMSYSCPVITSFTSSLPEIGGEACLYLDPDSVQDLIEEIQKLKDENVRNEYVKRGKERIKHFSWEKCARETLSVIQKAIVT